MKAFLRNYRQSPRKVRLLADLVRGREVSDALVILEAAVKRGALPLRKLLSSAIANAKKNDGIGDESALYVKEIRVDEGPTMKRGMPRAFGRSAIIRKRTSHISLVLGEKVQKPEPVETNKLKAKS
ncbi:MAG: 50S ribosomal protein L22 [Parcubacteria group bacterium]|nr:50S ribosomal protein L22 [Parcubacteria group bacterium]